MFEELGLENWTPLAASLVFGLGLGAIYGFLAQRSGFCLRNGLVGTGQSRRSGLATWLMALASALVGTQTLIAAGFLDFSGHRFHAPDIAIAAIVAGGLIFGAGMVLTRGCASRLSVLAATGNLRALAVLLVFAVFAHVTLKGILAPFRVWLGSFTLPVGDASVLANWTGGGTFWTGLIVVSILFYAYRSGARWQSLVTGAAIGALVPLGWFGTGFVLFDEFDPIALDSLAFTSASSETLFWGIAGTAIAPGFGVGILSGTLLGSFVSALLGGALKWQGFTSQTSTGRYLTGGAMMGVGGVLAGGCTIGAGLSGVSTLSVSAIIALASIAGGALLTNAFLGRRALPVQMVAAE